MKEIKLRGKYGKESFAFIDDDNYDFLNKFNWFVCKSCRQYYAVTIVDKKRTLMHRMILNLDNPSDIVDHIDRNGLNNQRHNLRIVNVEQNNQNARPYLKSRSIYKGIYKEKSNKWRARIYHNGIRYNIGLFESDIAAALAYDDRAKELFGEYAYLNFKGGSMCVEYCDCGRMKSYDMDSISNPCRITKLEAALAASRVELDIEHKLKEKALDVCAALTTECERLQALYNDTANRLHSLEERIKIDAEIWLKNRAKNDKNIL